MVAEHEIFQMLSPPSHICPWQNFIGKAMYVYKSRFTAVICFHKSTEIWSVRAIRRFQ